jgi:2,3-diaminopropionate biosynthesis protein SbnA
MTDTSFVTRAVTEAWPAGTLTVSSILDAVGKTPLVRLGRLSRGTGLNVFAKLEYLNPGGSIKDRPAKNMLAKAIQSGLIDRDTTVVESSSGNLGVALAQLCRYLGLRFVCVVDPNASERKIAKIRAYGGYVHRVTEPDPASGEYLPARVATVQQMLRSKPNMFWSNQYENSDNAGAHHETMREILDSLHGELDYIFVPVSSCGTLHGCATYLRQIDHPARIIAVDAEGSKIFRSGPHQRRRVPGLGAGLRPKLFEPQDAHAVVRVSDADCVIGCRKILAAEAILVGGSSGAVISALLEVAPTLPGSSNCVVVMPDSGDDYIDTIFNEVWVEQAVTAPARHHQR